MHGKEEADSRGKIFNVVHDDFSLNYYRNIVWCCSITRQCDELASTIRVIITIALHNTEITLSLFQLDYIHTRHTQMDTHYITVHLI